MSAAELPGDGALTWVIPNVGGEDPPGRRADPLPPGARAAAELFAVLFPAASALRTRKDAPLRPRPWPGALGPPAEGPVFPWLARPGEAVAWIRTAEAEAVAGGRPLFGAPPERTLRVHDKAFAHRVAEEEGLLPPSLRGRVRVLDPDACRDAERSRRVIEEALRDWPPGFGRNFTLKPRIGGSARGRYAGRHGRSDAPDLEPALVGLAERGGAVLEPWLDRERDFSAQLLVEPGGGLRLLGTLEILAAPSGRTLGHRGTVDTRGRIASGLPEDAALREAAALAGAAAARAGYEGPLGVDGFRFRAPGGGSELRPLLETNARFTLGMVVVGLVRRALPAALRALGGRPERLLRFTFRVDGEGPPAPGGLSLRLGEAGPPGGPAPVLVFEAPPEGGGRPGESTP